MSTLPISGFTRLTKQAVAVATLLAATLLASGPSAGATAASGAPARRTVAAAPEWTQLQGNAAHTGYLPQQDALTPQNVGKLSTLWTYPLTSWPYDHSEVAVSGGVVYTTANPSVTALDAATGKLLWQQAALDGSPLGTPAVQDGLVLVVTAGYVGRRTVHYAYALNSSTGAVVWEHSLGISNQQSEGGATSVTTTATSAYITVPAPNAYTDHVDALSLSTGRMIWRSASLPGCGMSDPSVSGGLVVIGSSGYLTALHAANGSLAWQDTLGGGCGFDVESWLPVISQDMVYTGSLQGVAAVHLASGAMAWENTTFTTVFEPMSFTGTSLIVGEQLRRVIALNPSDGSVLWNRYRYGLYSGITTFGDLAWNYTDSPSKGSQVMAANPHNGVNAYTSPDLGGFQRLPPVTDDGRVYVNLGNELLCLALPS